MAEVMAEVMAETHRHGVAATSSSGGTLLPDPTGLRTKGLCARGLRTTTAVLALLLLGACATPPAPGVALASALWADTRFAAPTQRITADDVFALSPAMQQHLAGPIASQVRFKGRQRGLVDALVREGGLQLEYDGARTRTAAEAFEARAGNCLSLVLLTAAFAKAMDLEVSYQSAWVEETFSRSGGLTIGSGHVNVTLGRRFVDDRRGGDMSTLTIDFLPPEDLRGLRTQLISEATVVAMYMNNRAAESLRQGAVDDAYWWARGATAAQPAFLPALNTLGVVYLRHGDAALAEPVFAAVLQAEAHNRVALVNGVLTLQALGRADEAAALRARLARIEPHPPYHFHDLGTQALARGELAAARALFEREIARAPYQPEAHHGLAMTLLRMGEPAQAGSALSMAMQRSGNSVERDRYAGKLGWLEQQRAAVPVPDAVPDAVLTR